MKRGMLILLGVVFVVGVVRSKFSNDLLLDTTHTNSVRINSDLVEWNFDSEWKTEGNPPECGLPLIVSPVDLSLVSGILYPGQLRGNDFKPHGGFRFDGLSSNEVIVRAVMDGYVLKASRYLSAGEDQKMIFYVNECGVMVMNDHLGEVSPKLEAAFESLPEAKEGDSRTSEIFPRVFLERGEVIANTVGLEKQNNFFVDFGVYDLRQKNGVNFDEDFIRENSNVNEYGQYALCWLDYLPKEERDIVKDLPAGGIEGIVSKYCW